MEQNHLLTLYKASAGSGKTYTLTREYLRHLMKPGTLARHILAITFTNAATADMKRKIVETLQTIAQGDYADWKDLLDPKEMQNLRLHPQKESQIKESLCERARGKLQYLLHHYQDFSIKTIDSFVQNLVRPFAFELGLPQNYTPDIELDRLGNGITERIIEECGTPGMEAQTALLTDFLQHRNESERSLNISQSILGVVKLLFSENSFDALESMDHLSSDDFRAIIRKIETRCKETETTVQNLLQSGCRLLSENELDASCFHEGKNGLYAWFSNPDIPIKKLAAPGVKVRNCVEKGILKNAGPIAEALRETYDSITRIDWGLYHLLQEINHSIYALALVNRAGEILEEIKETTAVIPISEFNRRIDKALSAENNDFIFERSGARYRHVFIDEFQDTSRLQWKNLRPLIENNLAQGNACLIVGDPKQSIYRFRNADIEQFVDLCQGKGEVAVEVKNLQSNWRSEAGIIAFNNLFYRFIKETYAFSQATQTGAPSLAEEIFSQHEQFHKLHTDALPEADPQAVRIFLAKNMGGEPLTDWYLTQTLSIARRFPPGDVTVLCRKNKHCKLVADFLVANGLKVSTPDALIIGRHEGLQLTIASLRYMESGEKFHRAETFFWAKRLGFWPSAGLFDTSDDLYGEWKDRSCAIRFKELMHLNESPTELYDTVEAVLRFWHMDRHADRYILSFLDIVQKQSFGRISDLLEWWDTYALSTPVCAGKDPDAIQVMSVHKSKGLEFKVVIMPFICDVPLMTEELFWLPPDCLPQDIGLPTALVRYVNAISDSVAGPDMAHEKRLIEIDNLNALYVATTRPCEKLFLMASIPGRASETFKSEDAIARFADAFPEYVEAVEDGAELPADMPAAKTPTAETAVFSEENVALESHPWRERFAAALPPREETPQIAWGNFMHRALSLIETFTPENAAQSLERALNEYPQFRERRTQALERLHALLSNPLLKPYFNNQYIVKTETGIAAAPNSIHIPDRVLIKDRTAVVLDYKTGSPHPQHKEQVSGYMNLIQQIGMETCRGFLIYINEDINVEEIPPAN